MFSDAINVGLGESGTGGFAAVGTIKTIYFFKGFVMQRMDPGINGALAHLPQALNFLTNRFSILFGLFK